MDRRTLLTGIGITLGSLAGCSGDGSETPGGERPGENTPELTPEPTPAPMRFPSYSFEEGEDGKGIVVMTLSNPGENRRETTLTVGVNDQDGERVSGSTELSIDAGAEKTYRVPVDVNGTWFAANGNLQSAELADEQ